MFKSLEATRPGSHKLHNDILSYVNNGNIDITKISVCFPYVVMFVLLCHYAGLFTLKKNGITSSIYRYVTSVNQPLSTKSIQLYTHRVRLILDTVRIQTFEQNHKDPQMKLKISFHFWSRLKRGKKKTGPSK